MNTAPRDLKKALKERYQIEFQVRSTPHVLYDLISTPSGFSEWFCDDVNVRGDEFAFIWEGEEEKAVCIGRKYQELIRFQWADDEDPGAFFELRIRVDPMTNDVALVVTDHAWPDDLESARMLWESQVATLLRVIGS
ncbi:MAG: SRPBCC domain-containing protein [Flavobacteriales bacterium]|nr:SRPBCC domain-containing protein [Flavobacteriales bacterium]